MKQIILVSILIFLFFNSFSQEYECTQHQNHHHHYEIGISNGIVYIFDENTFDYGLHLHIVKNIKHSVLGIGLGYEKIFDEHSHNNISLLFQIRPFSKFSFVISPGFNFENFITIEPAIHFEILYEFCLDKFHIGPVIEYSASFKDKHLSLGIHLAKEF